MMSDAGKFRHIEPLILSDLQKEDGSRERYVVFSTEEQVSDFIQKVRAEGRPYSVVRDDQIPLFFAENPIIPQNFGGVGVFRAIAKSALNVMAYRYPERARENWLAPVKQFIRFGGDTDPWVNFEYTEDSEHLEPSASFPIQHRVLIGFDADTGLSYAKVSFFGLSELCVRFGTAPFANSETFVYDVDPLASKEPEDVSARTISGQALSLPTTSTLDPSKHVERRLTLLLQKIGDLAWEKEAPHLVAELDRIRNGPEHYRRDGIFRALEAHQQRLLRVGIDIAESARRFIGKRFGESGQQESDAFLRLAESDSTSPTGVTDRTIARIGRLRSVMSDHLLTIINERPVESGELRDLLEGMSGRRVLGPCVLDEVGASLLRE